MMVFGPGWAGVCIEREGGDGDVGVMIESLGMGGCIVDMESMIP